MGGITEYGFPNGLRVLLFPDASNPKITVNMTYLVGSRHEGYGESGMAHLLEHLNFILTTTGRDIKKELTAHGATWNGSTNRAQVKDGTAILGVLLPMIVGLMMQGGSEDFGEVAFPVV